ncbi:MAG: Hsp33 family molecular chaperone HslO [Lachnospiraceae bacterium]|jgi:molecular chaperone Hsp33|nr:Hsp33 family molecular chaperone HslO [Lachnospiraceae bacterium]
MADTKTGEGDYLITATAAPNDAGEPQVRAFAATTRGIAEEARIVHGQSPVVTAALGRLMTAGVMMGSMMKEPDDLLTLIVRGDGPVRGMTVTADNAGGVKGYANDPLALMPANAAGHLNVGGIVGKGTLTVIRDLGLKEPYSGTVSLRTGEIAEDIAWYYASSEQIPSAVGLGVLMNRENTVRRAGGFILQMMPFAAEEVVSALERNLAGMPHVTELLDAGKTPEQMLEEALRGTGGLTVTDRRPASFRCSCSRDRVRRVLLSLGRSELEEMIAEGRPVELKCQFCGKAYSFTTEEIKEVLWNTDSSKSQP